MITIRHQIELESIFLISIVAAASLFFVVQRNNNQSKFSIASAIPAMSASIETITSKITISSQISPDGAKKVIMKVTQNSDNTKTYDFSTIDGNDTTNEQSIFSKTLDSSKSMTIPFNTWSPDNKYFFIQENAGDSKSIFAFKAAGASFVGGEAYLDVTDLFKKKNTGSNFSEATGWASETLIIINTTGSSYWFEIPSRAIIQLSTEF